MENLRRATKQIRNEKLFCYVDENDFIKKYKALKRYCYKSYKFLAFHIKDFPGSEQEGTYVVDIPTDEIFKRVHGQIRLKYSVKNNVVIVEDLEPSNFFLEGYMYDLETYKGIPYRNDRDKFKIDLVKKMEVIKNGR